MFVIIYIPLTFINHFIASFLRIRDILLQFKHARQKLSTVYFLLKHRVKQEKDYVYTKPIIYHYWYIF